jgi:hypothetical protein
MIALGSAENKSNVWPTVLLHCLDEVKEGSFAMRTLCHTGIACLLLGRRYKMNSQDTAFSALKA